jgi:hypothetical protein
MLIVEKVAPDIVTISLNMHGTRAIQKMIEFLNLPQQVSIKGLLKARVVLVLQSETKSLTDRVLFRPEPLSML